MKDILIRVGVGTGIFACLGGMLAAILGIVWLCQQFPWLAAALGFVVVAYGAGCWWLDYDDGFDI